MRSQTQKQIITIQIYPNISSNDHQTTKTGLLIEYNPRNSVIKSKSKW